MDLDQWWATGEHVPIRPSAGCRPGAEVRVFTRRTGTEGPWTTFLHGFPTSSWDWHKVAPLLPGGRRRLYVDHLGFGASEKPTHATYSFPLQLELVEGAWHHHDVHETHLVVHDYSVSIAQHLLHRQLQGTYRGPRITGVTFLNGGLFKSYQTPLPIQKLLHHPVAGPVVARLVSEKRFNEAMDRITATPLPRDELHAHWRSIIHHKGKRLYHKLSRYHDERAYNEARWTTALQETKVPLRFLWGRADPISGAPMVERVREVLPDADLVVWDDVGHYPQLEAPERVAAEIGKSES